MLMQFCLIRNGVTSTSVSLQVYHISSIQRVFTSFLRRSGTDSQKYHIIAYGNQQDISATDYLEESGMMYDVVNSRPVTGSHIELDLERI